MKFDWRWRRLWSSMGVVVIIELMTCTGRTFVWVIDFYHLYQSNCVCGERQPAVPTCLFSILMMIHVVPPMLPSSVPALQARHSLL